MNFKKLVPLFVAVLSLGLSAASFAEEAASHPCKEDGAKLCSGMKPGDHKFGPCMMQHYAEVSPACQAKMASNHPCMAEGAKLCPGNYPGDKKWGPCMKSHESELSGACKAKMEEHKGKKEEKKAGV